MPRSVKRKSDTDRKYKNSFPLKIYSTEKFVLLGVKSHTRPPLEKFLGPESYRFSVWFRGGINEYHADQTEGWHRSLSAIR